MNIKILLPLALLPFALSACSGAWFGEEEDPPLEGERISVLELQQAIEPDDPLAAEGLAIPEPWNNEFWPQNGGYPNHAMQHLALGESLKLAWKADIGSGGTDEFPLTAQPVVVDNMIYTLDSRSEVRAFNVQNGKEIWDTDVADPDEDDPVITGGLAFSNGVLYVTSGYNELLALDPRDGKIIWRAPIPAASRAAPTVLEDRVFVTTLDNRLVALTATSGQPLWEYRGIIETAGLLGAASAAAERDIVIPAFSSGELTALRAANGSVAWSDNLANLRRLGGLSSLTDIKALPVIDRGTVFAISYSGRFIAIDERTGTRLWQREIGGSETPWVAGDNIFVLSSDNQLVALGRENGAIRWVTQLPRWEDPEDRKGAIIWNGPVLAGGRLILAGTDGRVIEVDPRGGQVLRDWDEGSTISINPVVAGGALYLLSDDGTLRAYR